MIQNKWGASDTNDWSGVNVRGFSFAFYVVATTANTAFTSNPVDLSQINVKITANVMGQVIEIYNDVLAPGALDSGFYDGTFQQNLQIGTYTSSVLLAAASGVKEVLQISAKLDLHEILNLANTDQLTIEVKCPNGALAAAGDTSVSIMYYDIIEGVGCGRSIPQIKNNSLRASISSDKSSPGDNVTSVRFINIDKAGVTTANQVITNVQLTSDKYSCSDDNYEILVKRFNNFVSLSEANNRNQCFTLFDMMNANFSGLKARLNNVNLTLTLNSANMNASKNWVVTRNLYNVPAYNARAMAKQAYHAKVDQLQSAA